MTKEQLFIKLVKTLTSNKLFYGHAVIDAEDEAMMVLMNIFDESVNDILSTGEENVKPEFIDAALNLINQRISTRKPMAYILGSVNFCGLNFKIDGRALVPRSPIAELILNGFDLWFDINKINTALDLCTGSGCIGLSIAHYYKHVSVDLSDLSHKALSLANENRELLELYNSVQIIQSDLFLKINKKYDLIVTNPPYVSDEEYKELPEEYKKEPKLGLVTSQMGLSIPVKILLEAPDYLNGNGMLFLEVGYSDEALDEAFPDIDIEWIDFLNGGQGVCVFSKEMLLEYRHYFKDFLEVKHVI